MVLVVVVVRRVMDVAWDISGKRKRAVPGPPAVDTYMYERIQGAFRTAVKFLAPFLVAARCLQLPPSLHPTAPLYPSCSCHRHAAGATNELQTRTSTYVTPAATRTLQHHGPFLPGMSSPQTDLLLHSRTSHRLACPHANPPFSRLYAVETRRRSRPCIVRVPFFLCSIA